MTKAGDFKERNFKTVSQCQTVCHGDEHSLQHTGNSSSAVLKGWRTEQ